MKYKVTIKSTPEFETTLTARTWKEARRLAIAQAHLVRIRVLYSDEIWVEELESV